MQTAVFVAQGPMAEQIADDRWIIRPELHIHIVGIGGAGMSAIAHVLLGRGVTVSGSDMQSNTTTKTLQAEGAMVFKGHDAIKDKFLYSVTITCLVNYCTEHEMK